MSADNTFYTALPQKCPLGFLFHKPAPFWSSWTPALPHLSAATTGISYFLAVLCLWQSQIPPLTARDGNIRSASDDWCHQIYPAKQQNFVRYNFLVVSIPRLLILYKYEEWTELRMLCLNTSYPTLAILISS